MKNILAFALLFVASTGTAMADSHGSSVVGLVLLPAAVGAVYLLRRRVQGKSKPSS